MSGSRSDSDLQWRRRRRRSWTPERFPAAFSDTTPCLPTNCVRFGLAAIAAMPLATACGQQPPPRRRTRGHGTELPPRRPPRPRRGSGRASRGCATGLPPTLPEAHRRAKPAAPAPAAKPGRSRSIGKLEGPTIITDPAQFPKTFKEAPMLAELVKAGKLPPVEERIGAGPAGHQAGARDRQVRRHLAPRLHRPGRHVERLPRLRQRQAAATATTPAPSSCPNIAKSWEFSDGRQDAPSYAAQGDEVERRPAVHRRRLHVLVRGPLQEQGSDSVADRRR